MVVVIIITILAITITKSRLRPPGSERFSLLGSRCVESQGVILSSLRLRAVLICFARPSLSSVRNAFFKVNSPVFGQFQPRIRDVYVYIYIYMYTHIHTYVRTYVHTYIHTYIHTYTMASNPSAERSRSASTLHHKLRNHQYKAVSSVNFSGILWQAQRTWILQKEFQGRHNMIPT